MVGIMSSSSTAIAIKKVLVLGGSGRVGGSAVRSLSLLNQNTNTVQSASQQQFELQVAGRSAANWATYCGRLGTNNKLTTDVKFVELDYMRDTEKMDRLIAQHDLIIHTAGPFQGLNTPSVLESAMRQGKMYLDVCDDINLSRVARSKKYTDLAQATGGSAIISVGIWPGGSSLLAQKVIDLAGGLSTVDKVRFSFFTAGSGGAGPTILTATFLILGENVLTYVDNEPVYKRSATDLFSVDFGDKIGIRDVARLNLIECESCHASGVPTVETYFGTAPKFWNSLFVLMARLIPQKILQNRDLMDKFAHFSLPMVRLVDTFVGSMNGIRVDVTTKSGQVHTGLLTHDDLEKAVGDAIAAFAIQMLKGNVPPGVYFPETVPKGNSFREDILALISSDAITYSIQNNSEIMSFGSTSKDA